MKTNETRTDYRATPEQWESIERYADSISYSCILELRARIEALEAARQPRPKSPSLSSRSPFLATELTNMTNQHPITPPPELVQQWASESLATQNLCNRAAQWGADQELEACCEVLARELICDGKHVATDLHMIRRPKPPSLKEQALEALRHAPGPDYPNPITLLTADEHALIRRALEALPE